MLEIIITFLLLTIVGITLIWLFSDEHIDSETEKIIKENFKEGK